MQLLTAAFRISIFLLLTLPCFVGCGGGSSEPEAYTKETGPPEEGMVWNEQGEYWEYPQSGGGGYDYESGYSDDDYADAGASDEVPDQGVTDSGGGYDDGDSYGGGGNAPY